MQGGIVRQGLLDAIDALRPADISPASVEPLRRHHVLHVRYVEGLEAPVVQERLAISQSTYYREHQRAIEAVASVLRDRWGLAEHAEQPNTDPAVHSRKATRLTTASSHPRFPRVELPSYLSTFIGRERELADIRRLLAQGRLLTLTGPGGIGKTRLAVEAVANLAGGYLDGVWFVSLAPLRDPDLVLSTIAHTLGLQGFGEGSPADRLCDFIGAKRLLLVLDNFEHVVSAAVAVVGLLTSCKGLQALVTSREPLRVAGERQYHVPTMALGAVSPKIVNSIAMASEHVAPEAVRLFVDRALHVRPDFALTPEYATAVLEICRRLDGLPLAIELAAARVRLMPPQPLLDRLDSRLRLLTSGPRDAPERQQTLRAAIDWSYDLLGTTEQRLFRGLGVFVGGCMVEAAEAVCSVGGDLAVDVLDSLGSLVDKSLLQQKTVACGEPRFEMLETIREYALERLSHSGEEQAIRQRHAAYILALTEEAEPKLYGAQQRTWLDRLTHEHDNLRAVLGWAARAEGAPEDVEQGLRLVNALWRFWFIRTHFIEGRNRLSALLDRAAGVERLGPIRLSFRIARGRALRVAGSLAYFLNEYGAAHALLNEGLFLSRELNDTAGIAYALNWLGWLTIAEDASIPRSYLEEAAVLARTLDEPYLLYEPLFGLGFCAMHDGDLGPAKKLYLECLDLCRAHGDRWYCALPSHRLGQAEAWLGNLVAARAWFEESLSIWREFDDRLRAGRVLCSLAALFLDLGDVEAARAACDEALIVSRSAGARRDVADNLVSLGLLAVDLGDDAAVRSHLAESRALMPMPVMYVHQVARWLTAAAGLAVATGRPAVAVRLVGSVLRRSTSRLTTSDEARLQRWLDSARRALGTERSAAAWAEGEATSVEQSFATLDLDS